MGTLDPQGDTVPNKLIKNYIRASGQCLHEWALEALNTMTDMVSEPFSRAAILALQRWGSFKADVNIDVEVDVDIDRQFGSLEGLSKSVQVLFHGVEAVMILTLIILKLRALFFQTLSVNPSTLQGRSFKHKVLKRPAPELASQSLHCKLKA